MKLQLPFINKKNKSHDINLKYDSWDNIPISLYDKIVKISKDDDLTPMDKNIEIISLLSDIPSSEIWNMDIDTVNKLSIKASFINSFDFNKSKKTKTYIINNKKCTVKYNLNKYTFGQFQDFQTFYQMGAEKYLHNILATIVIPDGNKYADGYDLDEFTEALYNEMSITDAQNIMFFFIISLRTSLNHTKTSLISKMKKMIKTLPKSKKRTELMKKTDSLLGTTV